MLCYRLFIEEYFLENVWKNAIQRLKDTAPDVPESTISFYVNEFKNLKNQKSLQQFKDAIEVLEIQINPKYPENDINAYNTFEDLEKIVDYLKSAYAKPPKDFSLDIQIEGAKTIYKDDEIEIYRGLTRKACVEYSTGYSWCIGRPGAGNLYYPHRFKQHEPTFYFVKDLNKIEKENLLSLRQIGASVGAGSFKDKYHFFVIQVPKNGRERDVYFVTSAKNDGDKQMSWREIVSICPALFDKQDLFEHVPLNELERKAKDKFYNKPLPSLKEFANLSYEEKQIFLAVRVDSLRDLPDEYFFLLPDSLKKEFMAMGLGLTPRMYNYIIKDKDLNRYRLEVADMILTADNENIEIKPEMVYYFFGLNLDNYVDTKYNKRFGQVLAELINFDKYDDKDYWKKYIKYIQYVEDKTLFLRRINDGKLKEIISGVDESEINDDLSLMIFLRFSPTILRYEKYKSRLKSLIKKLETEIIISLIMSSPNRDWIALNLDESQINNDVLFKVFLECGEQVLENKKYKSYLKKFKVDKIIDLIGFSKSRDWIALNLDESQINFDVLYKVFSFCEKRVLEQEKYKSRLKEFEPRHIVSLISHAIDREVKNSNELKKRDWIALNLDESQINDKVLEEIFLRCKKEVLEQEKYKSRLNKLRTVDIIYLIRYSFNRNWIALNLDKSKINEELLRAILENCSSEVANEYRKYFDLN